MTNTELELEDITSETATINLSRFNETGSSRMEDAWKTVNRLTENLNSDTWPAEMKERDKVSKAEWKAYMNGYKAACYDIIKSMIAADPETREQLMNLIEQ